MAASLASFFTAKNVVRDDPEMKGVIPRAVDGLFESIARAPLNMQVKLQEIVPI